DSRLIRWLAECQGARLRARRPRPGPGVDEPDRLPRHEHLESLQRDPRGGEATWRRGRGLGDRWHHPVGRCCGCHQGGGHRAGVSHGPDPGEARVGRGVTTVKDQTIGDYVQALASTAAVPGGGSAAALAAAMGAALVSMVAKLSAKKAKVDADREVLEGL